MTPNPNHVQNIVRRSDIENYRIAGTALSLSVCYSQGLGQMSVYVYVYHQNAVLLLPWGDPYRGWDFDKLTDWLESQSLKASVADTIQQATLALWFKQYGGETRINLMGVT